MWSFISAFLGFLGALALFEAQELWKGWIQVSNLRRALRAELELAERFLSIAVFKSHAKSPDNSEAVKEFRWVMENRDRFPDADAPVVDLDEWKRKTGEELSAAVRNMTIGGANRTQVRKHPVLEVALSSIIDVGLSSREMVTLTACSYQINMLNGLHEFQMQLFSMTFTVEDPANHEIIKDNITSAQADYRIRLVFALKALRDALTALKQQSFWQYFRTRFEPSGGAS